MRVTTGLEGNNGADLVQGDNALTFQNDPNGGADVFIGGSGNDDHDAEGGDDIMTNNGVDRHAGMLGFDWVTHKYDPLVANADLGITVFQPPNVQINRSRFLNVEGLSGWDRNDVLRGNSFPGDPAQVTGKGHELTQENLDRIEGTSCPPRRRRRYRVMRARSCPTTRRTTSSSAARAATCWRGRGGDDFLDGDHAARRLHQGPGHRAVRVHRGLPGSRLQPQPRPRRPVDQACGHRPETDDAIIDSAVYGDVSRQPHRHRER
jgi:hypothetical protein